MWKKIIWGALIAALVIVTQYVLRIWLTARALSVKVGDFALPGGGTGSEVPVKFNLIVTNPKGMNLRVTTAFLDIEDENGSTVGEIRDTDLGTIRKRDVTKLPILAKVQTVGAVSSVIDTLRKALAGQSVGKKLYLTGHIRVSNMFTVKVPKTEIVSLG